MVLEDATVIQTPRLRLRPIRKADAARVATLIDDFDIARMTTRIPHPYAPEDAEEFLRGAERGDPERQRTFAVDHPADGLIGVLGFHPPPGVPEGSNRVEMGYWYGRPYWGHGYATEAARAALAWAKGDWRRRMVLSGHFSDNPASGQVLCKAGFLYTGEVQLRHSTARDALAPTRMMIWLA